jgi:hypothetical protein
VEAGTASYASSSFSCSIIKQGSIERTSEATSADRTSSVQAIAGVTKESAPENPILMKKVFVEFTIACLWQSFGKLVKFTEEYYLPLLGFRRFVGCLA